MPKSSTLHAYRVHTLSESLTFLHTIDSKQDNVSYHKAQSIALHRFALQKQRPIPFPPCPTQHGYITESSNFKLHKESLDSFQPRYVRESTAFVDFTKRKTELILTPRRTFLSDPFPN